MYWEWEDAGEACFNPNTVGFLNPMTQCPALGIVSFVSALKKIEDKKELKKRKKLSSAPPPPLSPAQTAPVTSWI